MFVRVKILALSQLTNQVSFASASPWGCMAMGCIHAHTEIPTGTVHRDLTVATVCTGLAPPDGLSPLAWQKQGEVKQHPLGTIRELVPQLGEDVAALATVPKRLQPWQCDTGAGGKETVAPLACTHCSVQDKPLDMGSLGWWGTRTGRSSRVPATVLGTSTAAMGRHNSSGNTVSPHAPSVLWQANVP